MTRLAEADLLRLVTDAAGYGGWNAYHTFDSRRSRAGFPDLVLAHPRRGVMFLELKTASGKLTADQRHWIATLTAAGADARVVRPADADALTAELLGRAPPE